MIAHRLHHEIDERPDRVLEDSGSLAISVIRSIHTDHCHPGSGEGLRGDLDVPGLATVVGSVGHHDDPFDAIRDVRIDQNPVAGRALYGPGLDHTPFGFDLGNDLGCGTRLVGEVERHRSRTRTSSRRVEPPNDARPGAHSRWIVDG